MCDHVQYYKPYLTLIKATTGGKMWCLGHQAVALIIYHQSIFADGTYTFSIETSTGS